VARDSRGILFAVQENRIAVDRGDGVAVVVVHGEHDVYTSPMLSDQLAELRDEGMPVVVDLTPATFVDSSVLRVLLDAKRQAEEREIGFAVALGQEDSGPVRRVLDITGLVPVLAVHGGREDAIAAARGGAHR
jgi:anti-anti-sigma factor